MTADQDTINYEDPDAPKQKITDPTVATGGTAPAPIPPTTTTAAAPTSGGSIYDTINSLYSKYNLSAGGNGSGFADINYWAAHPSEVLNGRLESDLAGTGSDQPTGTPGTGTWSSSGTNAPSTGSPISMAAAPAAQTGAVGNVSLFDNALGTKDASDLYSLLQGRANQGLAVDPNDPVIKAQVDAYRAEQTRAARNLMSEQAERGGVNSNQDATQRSATEKAAQNTAGFQGQLMANEVAARRQEIESALKGEQGLLTAQQQMALQQELANLDVKLRSYQFGQSQNQQEAQFARTLAERGFEFDTNSQYANSPLGS